jgi:hypothetical protein
LKINIIMRLSFEIGERHFLFLVGVLAVVSAVGIVTGYDGTEPSVVGHTLGELEPGTFPAGDYVFPNNLDVAGSISAANVGSVFIRWGNGESPEGATLLYSGFAFNEHHTHSGGSEAVCVKPSDPGATGPGSNYGDLLYPLGTGGAAQMPPGIPAQKEIKCAVCLAEGPTFEIWGTSTCPDGWRALYTGYGMAGYYSHPNPSRRHCVDNVDFDDSVANLNWGDIWYGTVMYSVADLPSGHGYTTNTFVKCAVCVKE